MSLLLLLLPVALAGLPPHHQKLVDRFGAENVNFDKNVSSFPDTFEKLWNQKKSKEDILIRCELPSVTLAWKSPLRAMEELRSINQTGFFFFNQTSPALLISWLEKQSFWQLLLIKISVTTTFPGLVVSQGTAPCGRTWFHSGRPTTLSKKQNPLKLCLSMNFLLP